MIDAATILLAMRRRRTFAVRAVVYV